MQDHRCFLTCYLASTRASLTTATFFECAIEEPINRQSGSQPARRLFWACQRLQNTRGQVERPVIRFPMAYQCLIYSSISCAFVGMTLSPTSHNTHVMSMIKKRFPVIGDVQKISGKNNLECSGLRLGCALNGH